METPPAEPVSYLSATRARDVLMLLALVSGVCLPGRVTNITVRQLREAKVMSLATFQFLDVQIVAVTYAVRKAGSLANIAFLHPQTAIIAGENLRLIGNWDFKTSRGSTHEIPVTEAQWHRMVAHADVERPVIYGGSDCCDKVMRPISCPVLSLSYSYSMLVCPPQTYFYCLYGVHMCTVYIQNLAKIHPFSCSSHAKAPKLTPQMSTSASRRSGERQWERTVAPSLRVAAGLVQ